MKKFKTNATYMSIVNKMIFIYKYNFCDTPGIINNFKYYFLEQLCCCAKNFSNFWKININISLTLTVTFNYGILLCHCIEYFQVSCFHYNCL